MSKILRSLIWKEWHEQRWKIAFGTLLLLSYFGIGLQTRILPDFDLMIGGLFFSAVVLPIFASMDLVAAEYADGSLKNLLNLPISPWITFTVKIVMGTLTCIVPPTASMILTWLIAGQREVISNAGMTVYIATTAISFSSFIWMIWASLYQPSEARSALVGIGLVVMWFALIAIEFSVFHHSIIGFLTPLSFWILPGQLDSTWRWRIILVAVLLWRAGTGFAKLSRKRP